jgi:hypothetical protein
MFSPPHLLLSQKKNPKDKQVFKPRERQIEEEQINGRIWQDTNIITSENLKNEQTDKDNKKREIQIQRERKETNWIGKI